MSDKEFSTTQGDSTRKTGQEIGCNQTLGTEQSQLLPTCSTNDPDQIFQRALEILRKKEPENITGSLATHGQPDLGSGNPDQFPTPSQDSSISVIPARMLNEFVYCPRLFYYEHVESVFLENADTVRGAALHRRVDSGSGDLRTSRKKPTADSKDESESQNLEPEIIHSRSVQMGSDRLGVVAKMDLVEVEETRDDLFDQLRVRPVDYKAGSPREGAEGNELWDTDKMQLGLQALILRDNGYMCDEGLIYYRGTKQRVRLLITSDLESWILDRISEARLTASGPIPPPLDNSPKCVRCSLAPICLPDETKLLSQQTAFDRPIYPESDQPESHLNVETLPTSSSMPRRIIPARDDQRALYLNTQGYYVGCKSEVLEIREKDKIVEEIRIKDLAHVALFGNIQISTQAVQKLCNAEIPLTYFSMGGWFYGITRGHGLKNVFLRMEQFRLSRDPVTQLNLARQFINGKIRNHRTMLMRNHIAPPEPAILKLKRAAEDALAAESLEALLGIEGAAAALYFKHLSGMIKVDNDPLDNSMVENNPSRMAFDFNGRNRRPPNDPINALLSLAYSLLSKDCTLAALSVGFDPYVGFLHQPRFGRPALALDLMEEFRPLIADSTVLNCINNRSITEKDFVRAGSAVNLSAEGRKRFFQTYEKRMNSLITHPLFDYKVSYRRALELQSRVLAKTLTKEIPNYLPLTTR